MKKQLAGFTLMETLVALVIVVGFVFLPTLALQRWQKNLEFEMFLARLERRILTTQQYAITHGKRTSINYGGSYTPKVIYSSLKYDETATNELLVIPQSIIVVEFTPIYFISGSGNNGNLVSIYISSTEVKRKVKYQFQMGSGRFVREEE